MRQGAGRRSSRDSRSGADRDRRRGAAPAPAPTVALAFARPGRVAERLPKRARGAPGAARRSWPAGRRRSARSPALTAAERTHLRALVDGGAGAGRAPADRCDAPAPPPAAAPPRHAQRRAGGGGRGAGAARSPRGFASFLLHGVTGSGKTEVYLRVIARGARGRARGAGAGARRSRSRRSWRRASGPASATTWRCCTAALPPRERLAAWRRLRARRGRHRARRALGGVRAGARARRGGRRRGARSVVQAGGGRALPRARPGARARAAGRRAGDPRLGHAVAGERLQRRRAGGSRACRCPSAATPRPLPRGRDRRPAAPPARGRTACCRRRSPTRSGPRSPPASRASCSSTGAASRRWCSAAPAARWSAARTASVSMTYHRGRSRLLLSLLRPDDAGARRAARRATRRGSSGWARGPSASRRWCASASPTRAWPASIATPPAAGRRAICDAILRRMQAGEIDILVGTQMVTKGHDFPGVTLVGVLQPDQGMHLPDFRAAERTFQLLEQVAGRAGRGERPGRVIIQTYAPEHPAIAAVARHDYDGFVRDELRRAEHRRLPAVRADDRAAARRARRGGGAGRRAARRPRRRARPGGAAVTVRGPAEAPLSRLRGRTRWQVWLSSHDRARLVAAARAAAATRQSGRGPAPLRRRRPAERAVSVFTPRGGSARVSVELMKLLIIAGPYEADRIRKAALSAGFETVAVEPGESLSGWITASRPELIVMAPQIVNPDPALALAKVRAVPRGRVPIFLVGDAADEARMRDLADGFFVRPIAPDLLLRAGARHPGARRGAAPAQEQQPRPRADRDGARPRRREPAAAGRRTRPARRRPCRVRKSGGHPARAAGSTLKPLVAAALGGAPVAAARVRRSERAAGRAGRRDRRAPRRRAGRRARRRAEGAGQVRRASRRHRRSGARRQADFAGETTKKVEPALLGRGGQVLGERPGSPPGALRAGRGGRLLRRARRRARRERRRPAARAREDRPRDRA